MRQYPMLWAVHYLFLSAVVLAICIVQINYLNADLNLSMWISILFSIIVPGCFIAALRKSPEVKTQDQMRWEFTMATIMSIFAFLQVRGVLPLLETLAVPFWAKAALFALSFGYVTTVALLFSHGWRAGETARKVFAETQSAASSAEKKSVKPDVPTLAVETPPVLRR